MPAEKPFEGDFLFVNHDAKQMKTSPHRRKVFSHVQTQYRNWKRLEDNRALRASIRTPLSERQPFVTSEKPAAVNGPAPVPWHVEEPKKARFIQSSQTTVAAASSSKQHSRRITISSLITEDEAESTARVVAKAGVSKSLTEPQSPDTMPRRGNSDPFNAYGVKIDPSANDMLGFYRDFVLPAMYHTTKRKWMTSASARRDWEDCIHGLGDGVDGLGDEGAGTGFLATCATVAALVSLNPSIQKQAIYYRSQSMALLRKRLTAGKSARGQISWHINLLLGAETLDGNMVGAAAHLNMLRHYFEHDGDKLSAGLLLYVVFHDVHISSMFLCRPVFDMDKWLPKKFQPLVDAAKPYLPDLSETKNRFLDPSVDNPRLRTLFIERRESLAVWLVQSGSDEESEHSCILLGWLQVRVYLHQGRLVNMFLEAKAKYAATPPPRLIHSILCKGYISLATLLYIRSISFNTTVCDTRLFDATKTILTNLQEIVELSEKPKTPNYQKYENARLWALYVGASAELFMEMRAESRGWFTTHFAEKAVKLSLDGENAWDKVRKVLKGFLYTDLMHPDGEEWFGRVLGTVSKIEKGGQNGKELT